MKRLMIALLLFFYGCMVTPPEDDGLQRQDCYAAADGGVECYPA